MNKKINYILLNHGIYLAWIIAIIATCSSLYLSEVLNYLPCKLCWYQRICMYPLVLLLGISVLTKDKSIFKYALPLSILGGCLSVYHYCLQRFPALENTAPCRGAGEVPCNVDYLNWYGFITIPLLALISFIIITFLLLLNKGCFRTVKERSIMKGYKIEPFLFNEEKSVGTKMSLEEFIKCCETDELTDYDGIASQIIINDYVVSETSFYPSQVLEQKNEFLSLQKEKGKVEIVWCNR
jgi:disulfide bond formation protein DsbB